MFGGQGGFTGGDGLDKKLISDTAVLNSDELDSRRRCLSIFCLIQASAGQRLLRSACCPHGVASPIYLRIFQTFN